jgi:hypothetical protein
LQAKRQKIVGVSNMGNTLSTTQTAARCQGKGGDLRSKYDLTLTPILGRIHSGSMVRH